jgi:hypothetical protein
MAVVALLTPVERTAPGYFRNPDWSVKDLVAHLLIPRTRARNS